ncbi:MAG TPA: fused MFS/spermidine synthase [Herpetosiphonaceae bacterium]
MKYDGLRTPPTISQMLLRARSGERAGFGVAALFTLTMFVSAALLFVVQPMFARMILPLLGGSPSVWNTAVVFYQVGLLGGYLYAHLTRTFLRPRQQALLHGAVILLPLLTLPIAVPAGWTPPTTTNPIPWLLLLLTVAIGLPYFVVSTSSPLLQSWFARTDHPAAHDPYFLYAASNVGSMLSLLAYPFVIEPRLALLQQSRVWSLGYGLLVLLVLLCVVVVWRSTGAQAQRPTADDQAVAAAESAEQPTALSWPRRIRWALLSAVPSSLMISVTAYLSSNIAPFPLLWIVPLALFLLTFILVFATRPPIPHWIMLRALPIVLTPLLICLAINAVEPLIVLFPLNLVTFFIATMVCHGELAADRPHARHLTEFYLWMSFGGALGGMLTALAAPVVFNSVLEYPIALVLLYLLLWRPGQQRGTARPDLLRALGVTGLSLVMLLILMMAGVGEGSLRLALVFGLPGMVAFSFSRRPLAYALALSALLVIGQTVDSNRRATEYAERSFFGINRVLSSPEYMKLVHGTIVHGLQSTDPARRTEPLSYYHRTGPLGQIFERWSSAGSGQRVAVVGLGVGSAACYAQPQQEWTFYEIDPVVEQIARDERFFSYLRDCTPDAPVVLGDARLMLADAPSAAYDMIILDAYSSDAIPTHLITREALALYKSRLAPGGLLLFHISNRYLTLAPVLSTLAADAEMVALEQFNDATPEEQAQGKSPSQWVVLAHEADDLALLNGDTRWKPLGAPAPELLWTDDFLSILNVFHW